MIVSELIKELKNFPSDYKVVYNTSSEFEEYDEVSLLRLAEYGRFRGGYVNMESDSPNAVYLS